MGQFPFFGLGVGAGVRRMGSDWMELAGVQGTVSGCLGRIFYKRQSSPFLTRAGILIWALVICLRSEQCMSEIIVLRESCMSFKDFLSLWRAFSCLARRQWLQYAESNMR